MGFLNSGKGKIALSFYDIATGTLIREPIQVEARRQSKLIGTYVIRDGRLTMNDIPRRETEMLGIITLGYYKYKFEIVSTRYKSKSIECEFDMRTKDITLDIALEPKNASYETKIY